MADREQATEHYDASNAVRLCDRCEDESGVSAGADAGDRACSICGSHDAPHVYPALPSQPTDDREGWLEVPDYRGGGVMGRRRVAPTDDRVGEGRHERWSFWQCSHCGFVKTYPHPPAGPGKPVCTYGHHPQSMLEVLVRAALNPSAPDRESE